MFVVLCMKENITVKVYGADRTVPMSWADGMVGALPVFETSGDAETYANGFYDLDVLELREKIPKEEPLCKFTSPS